MSNPLALVHLTSVNPPGWEIPLALLGDATYEPAGTSSNGGWQIIDRPRLPAAIQWYDRSPMSLVFDCLIDSYTLFGNNTSNIEPFCLTMDLWQDKVPGTQQPVVLTVSGPIPGEQRQWVMQKISFKAAVRDPQAGYRIQQAVNLTLYEYNSTLFSSSGPPSPAQTAQANLLAQEASQSYTLYTAGPGDTLTTIAANLLGDWTQWTVLATINSIRDPNSIVPGQLIKIPQF
jgi:hypothetical protein